MRRILSFTLILAILLASVGCTLKKDGITTTSQTVSAAASHSEDQTISTEEETTTTSDTTTTTTTKSTAKTQSAAALLAAKEKAEKERAKKNQNAAKPIEKTIKTTTTRKTTTTTKKSSGTTKKQPSVSLNVPIINQVSAGFPTGCEVVSATMLLKYHGVSLNIEDVAKYIPEIPLYKENGRVYGPDIREAFVGNPRNRDTSDNPNYGVWAPAVTKAVNAVLSEKKKTSLTAKNITNCSFDTLISKLEAGNPVIVWATSNMMTPTIMRSWYIKGENGKDTYFEYPKGTHVMVLSGYNGSKVTISDPYFGLKTYDKDLFISKWTLLKKQAIVIEKVKPTTTTTTTTTTSTTVAVSGITLDEKNLTLEVGKTVQLNAVVLPSNATNKDVMWETSNSSVVTVKAGKVTAVGVGTAKIAAVAGAKSVTCEVTVIEKSTASED